VKSGWPKTTFAHIPVVNGGRYSSTRELLESLTNIASAGASASGTLVPPEGAQVGVAVGVAVTVAVGVEVAVAVRVGVGVNVAVRVGVAVAVAVAVAVPVGVDVAVDVIDGVPVGVGDTEVVEVAVAVGVCFGLVEHEEQGSHAWRSKAESAANREIAVKVAL
jgi:hypothetical protein